MEPTRKEEQEPSSGQKLEPASLGRLWEAALLDAMLGLFAWALCALGLLKLRNLPGNPFALPGRILLGLLVATGKGLTVGLAAALFAPLEPLQRMLGLPAFLSRKTVRAAATNWNYSSDKAKHELGWTHYSAEAMWSATIDGEMQLLSKRKTQNLRQRLRPLEMLE